MIELLEFLNKDKIQNIYPINKEDLKNGMYFAVEWNTDPLNKGKGCAYGVFKSLKQAFIGNSKSGKGITPVYTQPVALCYIAVYAATGVVKNIKDNPDTCQIGLGIDAHHKIRSVTDTERKKLDELMSKYNIKI